MSNQKNYDSEFCGKVPLYQTNLIQPHGVLMLLRQEDLQVLQVSENIAEITGEAAQEVVKNKLSHYLPAAQVQLLQERFRSGNKGKIPFTFSFSHNGITVDYLALVQLQESQLIIEIDIKNLVENDSTFISVYQELKYVIAAIEATTTVAEAARIAVTELKRFSGFDRVMVYQFDKDWNGMAIAEELEEGMEPYLGLKFPASDIPKQARDLYLNNPYRLIPDVGYEPVRLFPVINAATHGFTNLSSSNLRSVAAVHLEYLRNMQAAASMSTRILKDGVLWGLISCHHRTPKFLSYQMCALFELLSNIISAKITSLENHSVLLYQSQLHQQFSEIIENIYKSNDLLDGIYNQQQQLLHLLNADGIAVVINKEVNAFGVTPDNTFVEDLVFWLQNNGETKTSQQNSLAKVYENAALYTDIASGLLVLPINPDKGDYVLAFRPEEVQKVVWGGNPNEVIFFEADKKKYHPRASFQQWQEVVKNNAVSWNREELEIAENFRNFVVGYMLNKLN